MKIYNTYIIQIYNKYIAYIFYNILYIIYIYFIFGDNPSWRCYITNKVFTFITSFVVCRYNDSILH